MAMMSAGGSMRLARPAMGGSNIRTVSTTLPQQSAVVDPNDVARREALAQALQEQSSGIQRIEHPTQGFAQLANALVGGLMAKKAAKEKAGNNKILAEALGSYTQGELSPERMNQVMALNPELGLQLSQAQQQRAAQEAARAAQMEQQQWERTGDPMRQLQLKQAELDYQQDLNPPQPGSAFPDPQPGYYRPDPSRVDVAAVPGGGADTAAEDAAAAEAQASSQAAAQEQAAATIEQTQRAVFSAAQQTNALTAGNMMGNSGIVPIVGQGAANLGATLETIKANLAFERLQQMREASPTGGALGSITERELAMLSATVASLDQRQSPEMLAANLAFINQMLEKMKAPATPAAGQQQPGSPGGDFTIESVEE